MVTIALKKLGEADKDITVKASDYQGAVTALELAGYSVVRVTVPESPTGGQALDKWDLRFMQMAREVSTWSKDPSTQTGAILVSPDRKDVVIGYNGFPSRMSDAKELYQNRDAKLQRIVHCEMNAVLNAKRDLRGYTLYTWPCISCDRCAVHMIAVGIARVVAPEPTDDMSSRWADMFIRSRKFFREADVQILEYKRDQ